MQRHATDSSAGHEASGRGPAQHGKSISDSFMTSISIRLFCAALAPLALLQAQDVTAVKAGTLYTGNGKTITGATILIEDGRITKVGKDVKVPMNATVVDASKHYVMPTWVLAHTNGGMDRPNENMPVTPFLRVLDSLDPSSRSFDSARRYGIGTLHVLPGNSTVVAGRGMIVKPYGKTPEEMALRERSAMKASLTPRSGSRSAQIAELRRAFDDAKKARAAHEQAKKDFEEEKKNGATTKEKFEGKIDPLKEPLLDVLDRKTRLVLYVPTATDVPAAVRFVRDYKTDTVFVLDAQLEYTERDPITDKETIVCPPKVLQEAGLSFALSGGSSGGRGRFRMPGSSNPTQQIPSWQVAACVRHGMSESAAIHALTTVPARILRLQKQVGAIAPGMDGNLQILAAAPLEPESQVLQLVIEGRVVYERSKDPRYAELTGEVKSGAEGGQR